MGQRWTVCLFFLINKSSEVSMTQCFLFVLNLILKMIRDTDSMWEDKVDAFSQA